jgi:hypothetical protein
VLYVGDHIFGDIIKSKKEQAFRFVYWLTDSGWWHTNEWERERELVEIILFCSSS